MRAIKRTIAAVCCAVMLSATACSSGAVVKEKDRQIELNFSWWGNDARNQYTIEAIDKFEELHPDIKVNCSYSEWSGYEMRNQVQMISDTEADVMQINYGWLTTYSEDGKGYYDLNKLSDKLGLDNFDEKSLSYGEKNGALNAVPIAMNAETVYINKSIYDSYGLEVPATWDDLFDAAKVMSKDGVYPMSAASKSMWLYLISYAEQDTNNKFIDDSGNVTFYGNEFRIMMEFYRKLVDEKVMPQVEKYERLSLDNEQYAGALAWISDAENYFGEAVKNGREIVCADYTSMDGSTPGTGWYAKPATMYAISDKTENPEEAAMLLDFLLNSSEMSDLQGLEKGIPLSKAAVKNVEKQDMLKGIQYDASKKMDGVELSEMSPVMENEDIIDLFFSCCNNYLYDEMTSGDAASSFMEQASDLLYGKG